MKSKSPLFFEVLYRTESKPKYDPNCRRTSLLREKVLEAKNVQDGLIKSHRFLSQVIHGCQGTQKRRLSGVIIIFAVTAKGRSSGDRHSSRMWRPRTAIMVKPELMLTTPLSRCFVRGYGAEVAEEMQRDP